MTIDTQFGANDIYGQGHPIETPELIEARLKELDEELEALSSKEKESWILAQEKCAPELLGRDFKLLFLRARKFQARSAAKRIVAYWTHRIDIFEDDRAFLPLTLEGALREDTVALEMGLAQLTGTQDPTGRSIIFFNPAFQDKTKYSRKSMGRAFWYVIHAALEDESAAQKGIIFITYGRDVKLSQFDRGLVAIIAPSVSGALPIRLAAMHVVHQPVFFSIIFGVIGVFMGEKLRKRVRLHGNKELPAKLAKFDLTSDILPVELDGNVVLDSEKWLDERRAARK